MKNIFFSAMKSVFSFIFGMDVLKKILFRLTNKQTAQSVLCNTLLTTFKRPNKYLEIGVDQGNTFEDIHADIKHGIDPYGSYDVQFRMSSEMFFVLNKMFWHHTYDVIFIDASHLSLIVDKEIQESLKILRKNGYIVLHDTDPPSKDASEIVVSNTVAYLRKLAYPHNKSHSSSTGWKPFNGDVWKSVARIRMEFPNLEVFTIDKFCCTVIKRGKQKRLLSKISADKLSWEYFKKYRKSILNVISFNDIQKYL